MHSAKSKMFVGKKIINRQAKLYRKQSDLASETAGDVFNSL